MKKVEFDWAQIKAEVSQWPTWLQEAWEERSAIMEFCGELTRAKAERLAFERCKPQNPVDS